MPIRVATIADLALVLPLRMQFFFESRGEMSSSELDATEEANRLFLEAHLKSPLSRTWIIETQREAVAIGTLAFFVRPQSEDHVVAIEAYLLNVFTSPAYRRRGFAGEIVAAAKSFARSQGLKKMWLHATDAGRPIYEAAGFQAAADPREVNAA